MKQTHARASSKRLALVALLALVAALAPFQILATGPGGTQDDLPQASGAASATPALPTVEPSPTASPPTTPEPPPETGEPSAGPTAAPPRDTADLPSPTPAVPPAGETPSPTPDEGTGSATPYVITFNSAGAYSQRAGLFALEGVQETSAIDVLRVATVLLPVEEAAELAGALRLSPLVSSVEPDRQRTVEGAPDDPFFPDQWALTRIGWAAVHDDPPSGAAVVAILDTGVDATHPELDGRVVDGTSFVDGVATGVDPHGHGTWMAGIVGAATDNGEGISGTGDSALMVMPVTVIGPDGTGRDGDIINGIVYAVDHGADVILMAFSSHGYSAALQAAVDYAWDHGVVLVAAAGNDGSAGATYPAGNEGVVGVSATQADDTIWAASNSGPSVFIAAPGAEVLTTDHGRGYRSISGTSAAAALVAAAAGLLGARDATLSNGTIVGRLARTAEGVGTRDQTGNGLLDLGRAWNDQSSASIKPAGALAGSGPYVGPYEPPTYNVASSPSYRSDASGSAASGATSIVISRPSGTVAGDTMIAAIAVRPATATITAPSGWTLIRNQDQVNTTASSQSTYYKVATSSEPSSYTFTLGSSPTGGAGGIITFYNASTCAPVDVSNSQANNTGSTSQAAPSVTTTQAGDMLITAHSFASSATWTPPSGMNEAVDAASEAVPNVAGVSIEMNYLLLGAAGATGTKTATASNDADVGIGMTVAIRATCLKTWDGGAGTNNWGDANNWNPNGVPTASDDVSLTGANTIIVNVAASTNDLTLNNASLVLTIIASQSLAVTGNLTVTSGTLNTASSFPSVSGTTSLAAASTVGYTGSGSQTVAALTYGNLNSTSGTKTLAGNVTLAGNLTVSGGTLYLSSFSANRSSAGGTLTISNGATLRVGGTGTLPSNYTTHSIGATSTVEYSGTTTSVVALNSSQSYGNLAITGSGVTTSASFSVATSLSVASGGSLVASSGTITMANGSSINNAGTLTFRGLTIPASATVTTSSSFGVTAALTTGSGAIFAPSGGTITLSGTAWSLALTSAPTFSGLTVAGTPTTQPSASFAVGGVLTVNGSVTFAPTGGTITLNNGAAIANSGSLTLQGLTLATSAAVSATGSLAVAGTFTVNTGATFSPAAASVISGAGTLTGSGTVRVTRTTATADFISQYTVANKTLTNLTVEYAGAAAQTISALTYGALKMNNASGATLAGTAAVGTTLTLSAGNITTGANVLVISSGASVTRTSGHIVGTLRKSVATGSPSVTFEIGDASAYAPVTATFASVSVSGTFSATTASGDHAQIASSTINPVKTANRTWTLTNTGVTFTTYTVTLNFVAGDVDAGGDPTSFKVGLYGGATWSYPTLGTVTSTSTQASGITTVGDFQVGEDAMSNAYRSAGTGSWATAATWQRWNGSSWVAAVSAPSSSSGTITIQSGHTVTAAAPLTIDETTVDAGGILVVNAALTVANGAGSDLLANGTVRQDGSGSFTINAGATVDFNSGAKYQHNFTTTAGTIPSATWATGSTVEIIGYTTNTTAPGGLNQSFYNFTWNAPSQSVGISLAGSLATEAGSAIAGTLSIVSTGSGSMRLLNSGATRTLTVGSLDQSGGTFAVRGAGSTGTTSMTLNVAGAFALSSGTFSVSEATSSGSNAGAVNVAGNFSMTGGTLNRTGSTGSASVTFNGTSAQAYSRTSGTISGTIDFAIALGANVNFGTSVLDGSSGTFTLSSGATIGIGSTAGITTSGATGNIQVSGTRTYSTGANYTYNGTSAQVAGSGLPTTVNDLTVANSAGVTLSANVIVGGTLALSSGVLTTTPSFYVYIATASGISRTSGHVFGYLARYIPTGSGLSRTFDIGTATAYLPVTVTFGSVSVAGAFTVINADGEHPNLGSSSISPSAGVNRYWSTFNSGMAFTTYDITFTFAAADVDGGANTSNFAIDRYASSAWSPATVGTRTSTTTQATGLSATGEFAIGEPRDLGIFTSAGDIGGPTIAGTASHSSGTYTMSGSGSDIWGTADQFQYVYKQLSGDFRITARVASITDTDPWAKAGVMIRETTGAGSAHAMAVMTPGNGMSFQYRSTTGGTSASSTQTGLSAPYWVRLTRVGDTFTAERSADGTTWTQQGTSQTIAMAASVYVGLAVTAHTNAALNTSTFDNVSIGLGPSITLPGAQTTARNQQLVLSSSTANQVSIEDAEAAGDTRVQLTGSNGTITLGQTSGLSFTVGDGTTDSTMTFTGTVSNIDLALDGMRFIPTTSFSGAASLAVTTTNLTNGLVASDTLSITVANLGIFTNSQDIGSVGVAGSSSFSSNTYTVRGSGADIWDTSDEFQFAYRAVTGDVRLIARVATMTSPCTSGPAKGGVMFRNTLNANSILSMMDVMCASGAENIRRTTTGGSAVADVTSGISDPYWVRLTRIGNTFTAERSSNGSTWTQQASVSIGMNATIYVGLAVSAVNDSVLNTVTFDNVSINTRPIAVGNSYAVNEDTTLAPSAPGVLTNDTDPESAAMTASLVTNVSNGSLTLNSNGSFSYTPSANYLGSDSFTYKANDGVFDSDTVTVTITVNSVNDAPVNTVPGSQSTAVNMPITFSSGGGNAISIADVDAGSSPMQVQLTATSGTLTLPDTTGLTFSAGDGTTDASMTFTGTISAINTALNGLAFAPTTQFAGTASVQIATNDQGAAGSGGAQSDTDSVSIDVINTAPTAVADAYSLYRDNTIVVAVPGVLANDTDTDPQTLTVQSPRPVSGPSHGSLTLNADGSFSYTPTGGYTGTDSFTYKVTDGIADSATATVTLTIDTPAYVSSSAWATSFSTSRYIELTFPAYVAAGATVDGATFRHSYRSYGGGTMCYYIEVYSGTTLIGSHGSSGSPLSCNSGMGFVTDTVSLGEVNTVNRANTLKIRLYVRDSAGARSEHSLATVGVTYWLGNP